MSTTVTATTTTPTSTSTTVTQSWLRTHERLLALALVLLVGYFGLNHILDSRATAAEARASVAEQTLITQKAQDAQLATTVAQVTQQYQQLIVNLGVQNSALATSLAARQRAQATQIATDAHLPLNALATRLQSLGQAPLESVTVSQDKIELAQAGAVAVTQTLELLPVAQADLKDTQATLGATQGALTQANVVIADQVKQITGLNTALVLADNKDKADVAALKAEGRKNSAKWFFRGTVIGFIAGLLAH